ncbi:MULTISPECIES: hypothetical protein [Methylobacterium]|uniref:hypothetical protein n=1 Tax=Methylobacterium TaxID=407 RepID=UPI00104677D9|nr:MULTISPECIES: hypothetical protein [Methylobacterium]MDR7040128.1 hypothetical protein [Methylobacterium sp. BE186]
MTIGFFDGAMLLARRTFGNGDLRQDISKAASAAVAEQCELGEEFYFSFNLNEPWLFYESDGHLYIEKVDSSPVIRIGIEPRKDVKAWVPRLQEAKQFIADPLRFPNLTRSLPDRESGDED